MRRIEEGIKDFKIKDNTTMKTILFALSVLIITAFIKPAANITYAQNCVCAECNYPCKTPMVHASTCKYKNNRQTEEKSDEKSEVNSINKGLETEAVDTELQMLMIYSTVKTVLNNQGISDEEKGKLLNEQRTILEMLKPETEQQKMMYTDIIAVIDKMSPGLKKAN